MVYSLDKVNSFFSLLFMNSAIKCLMTSYDWVTISEGRDMAVNFLKNQNKNTRNKHFK